MGYFDDLLPSGDGGSSTSAGHFDDLIQSTGTGGHFDDLVPSRTLGGEVKEVAKGVIPGAVKFGGTTLKGAAGLQKAGQHNAAAFGRKQIEVMDRIDRGETVPETEDAIGYQHMSPEQRTEARAEMVQAQKDFKPGTVEESILFKAGESVRAVGEKILPAAPGYENSTGRTIGEGLGSVAAGVVTSAVGGPVAGGAVFTLAGSGEAVERAVQHGATEEQIIEAAKTGQIPGLTDSLPVETLLGRVPLPGGKFIKVPVGMIADALKVGGRIGFQALVEGIQEGGQEFLQNAIEQEYNKDQTLIEGVPEGAGLGAAIGGILEAGATPFRSRSGRPSSETSGTPPLSGSNAGLFNDLLTEEDLAPATEAAPKGDRVTAPKIAAVESTPVDRERLDSPRLTPEDRASPIPNDLIDDGKAIIEAATSSPELTTATPIPAEDRAILRKAGNTDDEIDVMSPEERLVDIGQARQSGILANPMDVAGAEQYKSAVLAPPASVEPVSAVTEPVAALASPAPSVAEIQPSSIAGEDIDGDWARFTPESGTLNVPRSEMPQIKAEHRGAMVNFLNARGIAHQDETVPASELKPTQAEFSRKKVDKAKSFEGGDRSILVSSDGYVLDGHHQWLAKRDAGEDVGIIRLDAPMQELLPVVAEFPSATTDGVAAEPATQTALKAKLAAKRKERAPQDLMQFLAGAGGLRDFKGELKALDLSKHFIPGYGKLLRANGLSLDRARELAEEAGYISAPNDRQTTDVSDLLNAIEANTRGSRVYAREDQGTVEKRDAEKPLSSEEQARRDELDEVMKTYGLIMKPDEVDAMMDLVGEGMWPEEAAVEVLERTAIAHEAEMDDNGREDEGLTDAPFDTDTEDSARREATSQGEEPAGEGARRDTSGRSEPRSGEQDRSRSEAEASEPVAALPEQDGLSEKTEAGEQSLIPGVRPVTTKEKIEAQAKKPMRPEVGQKEPGGLFSDDSQQTDLMDFARFQVSPDQARAIPIEVSLPDTPLFAEAVANTPGAKITDEGLLIDLVRYQKDEQSGNTSVRTGVFYLPVGSPSTKHYKGGKNGYGGRVEVKGETLIKRPIFVKGATGGKAPEAAYDAIKGKGAYDKMRSAVLRIVMNKRTLEENGYNLLEEYGADGNLIYDIIPASTQGNTLAYALQENIVAHAVREAGYDAVIGYSVGRGDKGTFLSEVFDVREVDYPTPGEVAHLHPDFESRYSRNDSTGAFRISDRAGGVETEFVLTEAFVEKAAELTSRLRKELDKLGLSDIGLRVSESISAIISGKRFEADGRFFRNVIDVALDTSDPSSTLNHEAIHALRKLGLFSTNEWSILARKAESSWNDQYGIADTYAGLSKAAQLEEGIAHAYADWVSGSKFDGILARSFKRIKGFIEALGNALNGLGFKSADSIFRKVGKGEVGARPRKGAAKDKPAFSLTERGNLVDYQGIPSVKAITTPLSKRIMSSIKRGKEDAETLGEYSHRKLVDYLHPVRTMIESVGGTVQDTMNAYLQARLAEDVAMSRIQGLHNDYVTPMVEALSKSGASLDDLHRYLYARHAPERNRVVGLRNEEGSDLHNAVTDHDIKGASGWSTNEAKRAIRELQSNPTKFAGIQEAARLARAMLDNSLLDQKKAGLISDETYKMLTEQWQHYVPLRAEDGVDENGNIKGGGRGFDVRGKEFKAATGRSTEAENIPAWAVSLAERTHLRAEKNAVGKAMLRFINHFDPKGERLAKVYWSEDAGFGDLEKAPAVHQREIGKDGKVTNRTVPPSTIAPDMFAVKVGGKTFYIKFADEKVGLALKKMGTVDLDALSRLARKWTGFQSLINTRANPAFVPINIIRDAATGGIHLTDEGFSVKESAKIIGTIPSAWGALWRNARGKPGKNEWDAALKEYIAAGGKITFEPHKTLEDSINELRTQMREAVDGKPKWKAVWQTFIKFVGDLNDSGENGMRLAAYVAARAQGRTVKQAAFLGRDLTVDFKKHGEVGPLLNSWFVFFNASLQGNYNIAARLLKSKKVRQAAFAIATSGVLVDLLNRSLSGDDDDGESYYSKMLRNEPWKFERAMVIFYGGGKGDYFTIPLPYGYNAIYHMGVQAAAAAHGDVEPLDAIAATTRVAFDAFNPIGGGGSWLNMFVPTILDPAVEVATNQSFTGAPITPAKFPGDNSPDSQRHFASTPDWARTVADWMNTATGGNEIEPGVVDVPPDVYEHLWGYVSGGIGRFFGQVIDTGTKVATGRSDEIEPQDVPWVRSFFGKVNDDTKRSEYYKQREEVQTAKDRLNDYHGTGKSEDVSAFIDRNRTAVESIKAFDAAEKSLRKIRKAKRQIDLDRDKSRSEKDEKLKPLKEAELKIMNAARMAYGRNRNNGDS